MKTNTIIIMLSIFLVSCGSGRQSQDDGNNNHDLDTFWEGFQKTIVTQDYSTLSDLTFYPFLNHGFYLSEQEFSELRFPEYIIEAIGSAGLPVKSSMMFGGGSDIEGNFVDVDFSGSEILEVDLDGPAIYFAEIDGKYKFIAILYGE